MPKTKQRPKRTVEARDVEGTFHGYAATWDAVPPYQFTRGAFAKSVAECGGRDIPVMVKHMRDGADVFEQVGILTGAHEDEIGLAVSGKFHTDALSQSVREKVQAGAPRHFSVGFEELQAREEEKMHITTEARLVEVTITNNPQNPNAVILDAREKPTEPLPLPKKRAGDTQRRWALELMQLLLFEVGP